MAATGAIKGHFVPLTVEICILAGGLSRRMGRDKARLRLGSRTLLQHVSAKARATDLPVRIIRKDIVPGCGPLGGLHTALEQCDCDAVLALACDMPFVTTHLLRDLVEQFDRKAIFVSHAGRPGFPLLLPKAALPTVKRNLDRKRFALHALAKCLRARLAEMVVEDHELANVNTPEEYRWATRIWAARRPGKRRIA